ncbi:autotransporter domain-containing protein [Pseudomonas brassicacearum]|uniref:autotransporter outer membrane beta-barrel domain-containing protein n=1 Tax=Pseudomonas brassicacearum TaxID=930166 RepID=UPI001294F159|nr:autotransporter outer membrane beta-barrel domain-containing protein [Pseudomonas brassicacearum]QGA52865.1 autotransporter outer membrane beta-barrel domain-containing protein [Pseudomonas brassicacearum]
MPTQHTYLPQHLALAIALALGCADVSMAQQPTDVPTTAELQERLKALAEAPDTKLHNVDKPRKAGMKLTKANDLVNVSANAAFGGMVDGGAGTNVLRLDAAVHSKLADTRNFLALHVTKGEWEHIASFTGWGVIEPKTKLINTGLIDGQIGVLGEFDNKGDVANNVIVEPGARMANTGTVTGRVDVRENATFSGSGTVGLLNVEGQLEVGLETGAPLARELSLSKTAVLIYGVDEDGRSSTINVDGTARLNNATLKIVGVPGKYIDAKEHTVIKAGQIVGEFGMVISELKFMTATLHPTATQVSLTYARNAVPIEAAAISDYGRAIATSIEEPQPIKPATEPNAAINALLGSNLITAANALDQLSGYDTADLGNATLSSVAPIRSGMLSAMSRNHPTGEYDNGQVWVQAIGNSGSLAKQLGSYALKHSTKGLMLGTDWAVSPDWRLGIIGSKTQTRLDSYQFDGALDSWLVGAYALRQDGPLALRLGAVHGNHDGSTKRHVAFNGFRDRLKGRYDATTQQVFGQVGYNLDIVHFDIEPYVQVGYQRYQRDAYTEKGGDAALQYNGQAQEHYSSDLGLRLARTFALDQGMRLTPRLDVGWKHLYGNVKGSSHQRLVRGGNTYIIEGVELDRDSLLLKAGLDLAVSPRHTLGLNYRGETGQDNRNGALMGQWRMMF